MEESCDFSQPIRGFEAINQQFSLYIDATCAEITYGITSREEYYGVNILVPCKLYVQNIL